MLRKKQKDKLYKNITFIFALLSVIYIGLSVREQRFLIFQNPTIPTENSINGVDEGYERFETRAGFSFQYPVDQSPIKALNTPTNAVDLLTSRNFRIGIYEGVQFKYQPWLNDSNYNCVYDGAMHSFAAEDNEQCRFERLEYLDYTVLSGEIVLADTKHYVTVVPVLNREYFMTFSIEYTADCGASSNVCDARALQRKDKLLNFTKNIVEKNHNLFTQ